MSGVSPAEQAAAPAPVPASNPPGRIGAVGILVLALLAALIWFEPPWNVRLQSFGFDTYQILAPRRIDSMPATVVAIDEKSLVALGQWPWPRTILAELIRAAARYQPAAIGVEILMPEADRLSAEQLLEHSRPRDAILASRLADLPSNDAELARAIAAAPVVLGLAASNEPTGSVLRAPPFTVVDAGGPNGAAPHAKFRLPTHAGVVTSIDPIDRAAAGHGLISVELSNGVIRRAPLVFDVDGTLAPALSIEMLRIALQAPGLQLRVNGSSIAGVAVGNFFAPTEADGRVRIYFSRRDPRRYVSAIDVLNGTVDPVSLQHKLLVVDTTGLGLAAYQNTPLNEAMPASEIQAQLLENLFDQTLLRRPSWALPLELLLFVLLGLLLVWATPRWTPRNATILVVLGEVLLIGASYLAYRSQRLLFDAATPGLSLLVLFSVLLVLTLAEAARQRKALERVLQTQREQAIYIAGELQAAQRIQTGTLPRPDLFKGDDRIDLAATMSPAREVGGDLYDYFLLDDGRLFFLIGDVAGKGLSASIFMAVSKALYKSAALRARTAIGDLMSAANIEVSRDNSEMFFVTVFAAMLDLESGELEYCNAGHENPYSLHPHHTSLTRLADGGGPPLCVVDGFGYRGARYQMRPGEVLVLVTDGVTDAQNPAGAMYGGDRLRASLSRLDTASATARSLVDALRADIASFTAGAEPADDLTLLAVRWIGPRTTNQV